MEISIFLAKTLGIYLLVISLSFLINQKSLRPPILEMIGSPAFMLLTGFIALIIGILLIVSHNIWVMDWRIIITIIGWLAFIKGITRLVFPEYVVKTTKKWVENDGVYYTTFVITLILGIILFYLGYGHF